MFEKIIKPHTHQKAQGIKFIITDVDGVLNDGSLFIAPDGTESFGKFSIYDGFAFELAHLGGIQIIVLSGRGSSATEARFTKLGALEVHAGVPDKLKVLNEMCDRLNLNLNEVAYIGDDLVDFKAMQKCGFRVATANANCMMKANVDYVTKTCGGNGALRELVEYILHAQNKFEQVIGQYLK